MSWHILRLVYICRHLMPSCNACQGSVNDISSTDMLVPSKIANSRHQEQPGSSMPLSLPERPDQPECQYYMKTGSCKYGTSCKYHHPKEKNQADMATIGPLGLPLRPVNLNLSLLLQYSLSVLLP